MITIHNTEGHTCTTNTMTAGMYMQSLLMCDTLLSSVLTHSSLYSLMSVCTHLFKLPVCWSP